MPNLGEFGRSKKSKNARPGAGPALAVRSIFLTAVAAMVGAGFILLDPIFKGLAISLIFGLASSTILTVLVIPAIYVLLSDDGKRLDEDGKGAPAPRGRPRTPLPRRTCRAYARRAAHEVGDPMRRAAVGVVRSGCRTNPNEENA